MDLTHKFTVPASIGDTWAAFSDLETVAGCFPGALLTSVEGDDFKGSCKVKLGPIALVYNGSGTFVERDDDAHRFVIEAKGKDKRGNGTAGATVTASLISAGEDSTDVEVLTDLSITGKPAQFGRGLMQDVSDKLLQQFVDCLESKLGSPADAGESGGSGPAAAPDTDTGADTDTEGATRKAPASAYASSNASTNADLSAGADLGSNGAVGGAVGSRESPDALDLGATVLPILLKAYWKPIAGAVVGLWLLRKLFGRRRS